MTKPLAIGVDVGGSKIAAGVVDRNGTVTGRYVTRAHSEQQPELVIDAILEACHASMARAGIDRSQVAGVGLGFGGTVNGPAGIVYVSSNLPAWHNYPLRDTVQDRLGLPVQLDNDANVCALAEHCYGAGRGSRHMCYVTLSTGFGLGIIADNQLYRGHTGTAAEIAHAVVDVGGPPCTCGKHGCLMAYASGVGISRMAYDAIRAGQETSLAALARPDGHRIPAEEVATAATAGDAVAAGIIRQAGYYSGVGLSLIVQILNPELIVVGGGLTHIGRLLEEPMLAALHEHTQPELWHAIAIKPWQLGQDQGVIGAAVLVLEH